MVFPAAVAAAAMSGDLERDDYSFIEPDFADDGLRRIHIFDAMKSDQMPEPTRFGGKLTNGLDRIGAGSVIICQHSALVIEGDIVVVNVEIISGHSFLWRGAERPPYPKSYINRWGV
jgi:hypothetical protein